MTQFELVEVSAVETQSTHLGVFPDGKLAASVVSALHAQTGGKNFQPRPLKDDSRDWRIREAELMAEREPPGWDLAPIPDHFAHRDPNNAENIRYVPDAEHGEFGRYSSIHCSTYLHRNYTLGISRRRKLSWAFTKYEPEVLFATGPDEIVDVYTRGPRSCMSRDPEEYATEGAHPVERYGDSDFALAYIVADGDYIARALVWPEKKIIARTYGDEQLLLKGLYKLGYRVALWGEFEGARIPTYWVDDVYDVEEDEEISGYVMPYLDTSPCNFRVENGTAILDEFGAYHGQHTSGVASEDGKVCGGCGKLRRSFCRTPAEHGALCGHCLKNKGLVFLPYEHEWLPVTDDLVEIGGYYLKKKCLNDLGYVFRCPETGELWPGSRAYHVENQRLSANGYLKVMEKLNA